MSDLDDILEDLWFGDTDISEIEHAAATSKAADVATRGLRPFPASVARLAQVLQDPEVNAAHIEQALATDPVIASKVLAIANSSQYGGGGSIDSLRQAVVRLGATTVYQMVVEVALQTVYKDLGGGDAVIAHSGDMARAVELLQRVHPMPQTYLYLAALLHDVGRLLLIQSGEAVTDGDGDDQAAQERAALGFDHALLGAVAVTTWGLPAPIPQVIGAHHEFSRALEAGPDIGGAVAAIRVAEDLLHMATLKVTHSRDLVAYTNASHWDWLGLDHTDAYDLLDLWHERGELEGSVDWKVKIRQARQRHQRRGKVLQAS